MPEMLLPRQPLRVSHSPDISFESIYHVSYVFGVMLAESASLVPRAHAASWPAALSYMAVSMSALSSQTSDTIVSAAVWLTLS